MQQLSLEEGSPLQHYSFLGSKPIRKRNRRSGSSKDRLRRVNDKMENRIRKLEALIEDYKSKEDACPHCHFYLNSTTLSEEDRMTTPEPLP